jgi:hypothetical protein
MSLSVFVGVLSLALLVVIIEFVRRRKLRESFALLWLFAGFGGVVIAIGRPAVDWLSDELGIAYGTSLVFTFAIVFLLAVCMYLSLHVSRLSSRVELLAEEVAVLKGVTEPAPVEDGPAGDASDADPAAP